LLIETIESLYARVQDGSIASLPTTTTTTTARLDSVAVEREQLRTLHRKARRGKR
jgi:hypothetical protein